MGNINDIVNDIDRQSPLLAGERSSFLLSLMALSAYVVQIDGDFGMYKYSYVRNFIATHYDAEKAAHCDGLLSRIFFERQRHNPLTWAALIEACAREVASYTSAEERMLILDYLIFIAQADGRVNQNEVIAVTNAAVWLGISPVAGVKINELKSKITQP
ncbi:MAG: TerB family tellurite resistance protein [Bacteroidales bacterium]|nr:TerB family tellurite resistance protein [Bacteroidales bacterium]